MDGINESTKSYGNTYILIAIAASLFNAFGQIIRGYESGASVVVSNFIFGSSWLIMPIFYIIVRKSLSIKKGETWILPWNRGGIFSGRVLLYLILGGALELAGCLMMMISFNLGQRAHMNDGITSALILFGGVFVLIFGLENFLDKLCYLIRQVV